MVPDSTKPQDTMFGFSGLCGHERAGANNGLQNYAFLISWNNQRFASRGGLVQISILNLMAL